MKATKQLFSMYKIVINISKQEYEQYEDEMFIMPENYRDDFQLNRIEYDREPKKYRVFFQIKDKYLMDLKGFIIDSLKLVKDMPDSFNYRDCCIDDFILDFNGVDLDLNNPEKLDDKLGLIKHNYLVKYERLYKAFLYTGWPKEPSNIEYMEGFILYNSPEKLKLAPEIDGVVDIVKDKIKKDLSEKYKLAKYLISVGY